MGTNVATTETGKRLTLSEIVTHLLTRTGGDRSSVNLSRNARGVTQIDVTVRTGDSTEITTAVEAEERAVEIYERLRAKYPLPSGYVGSEGNGKLGTDKDGGGS